MYWTIFSNASGNVLRIITNKNSARYPQKCGDMYGNAYGKP